jgi:hypothetical protein
VWEERDRRRGRMIAVGSVALAAGLLGMRVWLGRRPAALGIVLDLERGVDAALGALGLASAIAALTGLMLWLRARHAPAPARLTAVLLALVVGDLAWTARRINLLAPSELMTHKPGLVAEHPELAGRRTYTMPLMSQRVIRVPHGLRPEHALVLGVQEMLVPPSGGRWGIYGSFDGDFTGLAPQGLASFGYLLDRHRGAPLVHRLLQVGAVDYVLTLREEAMAGLDEIARYPSVFATPIRLLRVRDPLPWAYAVDGVRIAAADLAALVQIVDTDFDPHREVMLDAGTNAAPTQDFRGAVRVLSRKADALSLEVDMSAAGYVVVADTHHPGWSAEVDGEPGHVRKANTLFRAVAVPAGRHRVDLRYRPAALKRGLAVSGIALVVFALLLGWNLRGALRSRQIVDTRQ